MRDGRGAGARSLGFAVAVPRQNFVVERGCITMAKSDANLCAAGVGKRRNINISLKAKRSIQIRK